MIPGAARRRPVAPLVVLAAGSATRYGGVKPLAPVGIGGEAVIDVLASDALEAGFASVVLVIGPETGPAIRYHVERTWPPGVDVRFATQRSPRGTVDAVLVAARTLEEGTPFAVANADDLPGVGGLRLLAAHLAGPDPDHALVAYQLGASLVGDAPVTRGICTVAYRASMPPMAPPESGTPITGRSVWAATAPGKAAERPAPQMRTRRPRARAVRAYSATASGVRCAERTSNS